MDSEPWSKIAKEFLDKICLMWLSANWLRSYCTILNCQYLLFISWLLFENYGARWMEHVLHVWSCCQKLGRHKDWCTIMNLYDGIELMKMNKKRRIYTILIWKIVLNWCVINNKHKFWDVSKVVTLYDSDNGKICNGPWHPPKTVCHTIQKSMVYKVFWIVFKSIIWFTIILLLNY